MNKKHKRIALLAVSSIIFVAICALIGHKNTNNHEHGRHKHISITKKTFKKFCPIFDHEDACINNLWSKEHNVDQKKELIKMGFSAALKHMKVAAQKSSLLFHIHRDFRTKGALDSCNQLSGMAIHDIHRTSNMFIDLDVGSRDKLKKIADLKIWISGAMTHQETCLDGFIKTPGHVGERMRLILKSSMHLTTNILDMICDITSIFVKAEMKGKSRRNRHLLSLGKFPYWVDSKRRGLIEDDSERTNAGLVVAKDGSGNYTTINEAMEHVPKHSDNTFMLYIKEGVYEERVQVNSSMINLMMIGDGPTKTKITGHLNVIDGTPTFHSATVAVNADYFIAKDIGFENTAGPEKDQAVALRVSSDKSIFYNCQMDGYQDTLYTHTYRQFYRDCTVSGTIDFVFGDAAAVFQNCTFLVRKPLEKQQNIVTAQGRKNVRQPTGLVLQNCTITADSTLQPVKDKVRSYLARPWKEYSRTIFMESFIDDLIQPEGYLKWNDTFALDTLFYTEFNNRGPGSNKDKRVKWPGIKQLNTDRILHFTVAQFIDGDTWISKTNVPYAWALVYSPPSKYDAPVSPTSMEENADLESGKDKKAYVAPKEEPKKPEAPNSASIPPPKDKAEAPDFAPTPPKDKAAAPDSAPTPTSKDEAEAPDSASPPPSKDDDETHETHVDESEASQPPASEEEDSQAKEPGEDTLDGPDDKGVIFEREKSLSFTFP